MKRVRAAGSITEYIDRYPPAVRVRLRKLRTTIKRAAPGCTEAISYGIPTFKRDGNLVYFGAFAEHIGFFPGSTAIRTFARELAKYPTSKGTVRFPHDKPIPYGLVTRITKFCARRNAERAALKRRKKK